MKTSISPGDLVVAKKDFYLYEKEYEYSKSVFIEKNNISLVVAVKIGEDQRGYLGVVSLCVLCLKSGQIGWVLIYKSYVKNIMSVVAHA